MCGQLKSQLCWAVSQMYLTCTWQEITGQLVPCTGTVLVPWKYSTTPTWYRSDVPPKKLSYLCCMYLTRAAQHTWWKQILPSGNGSDIPTARYYMATPIGERRLATVTLPLYLNIHGLWRPVADFITMAGWAATILWLVRVVWRHNGVEEQTWEREAEMKEKYPFLF